MSECRESLVKILQGFLISTINTDGLEVMEKYFNSGQKGAKDIAFLKFRKILLSIQLQLTYLLERRTPISNDFFIKTDN